MSWPISTERISYCHTAKPRGSPRNRNTNESRVAGMAATSNWSCCAGEDWAAAPAAPAPARRLAAKGHPRDQCVGSVPYSVASRRGVEREREKLLDVPLHVLHP